MKRWNKFGEAGKPSQRSAETILTDWLSIFNKAKKTEKPNKALHLTAIPLRSMTGGELWQRTYSSLWLPGGREFVSIPGRA
jgi:hypothetical protein